MKTRVSFTIDSKLKMKVQKKVKKLGVSLGQIVTSAFREFLRADESELRSIYGISTKPETGIKI